VGVIPLYHTYLSGPLRLQARFESGCTLGIKCSEHIHVSVGCRVWAATLALSVMVASLQQKVALYMDLWVITVQGVSEFVRACVSGCKDCFVK
jgi:hypothetical protein